MTEWTPERIVLLKSLIADKHSGSEAASTLGISRSAAMGKAARLGLSFISVPPKSGPKRIRKPAKARPQTFRPNLSLANLERAREAAEAIGGQFINSKPFDFPDDRSKLVVLTKLTDSTCRWPYGDPGEILYCGEMAQEDKPYCADHCRIAFNSPTRR